MPTYQQQLKQIHDSVTAWKNQAVSMFADALIDEHQLLEVFRTRESLVKNGARFPGLDTLSTELRDALEAIDRRDFTIYERSRGDADRLLYLVGEPDFAALSSIRDYMPLSRALIYDADAFHTIMLSCYADSSDLGRSFINLRETFPDEIEDALAQQKNIEFTIKQAIEQKILQLEYRRIETCLMEEQSIPLEFKEEMKPLCIALEELPSTSANDLRDRIVLFNLKYQGILTRISVQKESYEQKKQELQSFVENTANLPERMKREGMRLLEEVSQAEIGGLQHLHTIYQPACRAIAEFLNSAFRDQYEMKKICNEIKQAFQVMLNEAAIREEFKVQAREHFAEYLEAETSLPQDELLLMAEKLEGEIETIHQREVEMCARERLEAAYAQVKAKLLSLVANVYIPDVEKVQAKQVLQRCVSPLVQDETQARGDVFDLTRECNKLENVICEIQDKKKKCAEAQRTLQATLDSNKIRDTLKVKGRILMNDYLLAEASAMPDHELFGLADGLLRENLVISQNENAQRRYDKLNQQHALAVQALQAQMNDARIPSRLKEGRRDLLGSLWEVENEEESKQLIFKLNAASYAIALEVREIAAKCNGKKDRLEQLLESDEVRESFKAQGQALLDEYIAQETTADWDTLFELAKKMGRERKVMLSNEARALLQEVVDDLSIPNNFKANAKNLLANQEISWYPVRQEYQRVLTRVADQKRSCHDKKLKLEETLQASWISAQFKIQGRELLQAYLEAEASESFPLDILMQRAEALEQERVLILKKDNLRWQWFNNVIHQIDGMKHYGKTLERVDQKKSEKIEELADLLIEKMNGFVEESVRRVFTSQDVLLFTEEFKVLLHSKDAMMEKHRAKWKPIVANILLALTGVGFLALLVKVGANAVASLKENREFKFNRSFFFAKTNSEQHVHAIENKMDRTKDVLLQAVLQGY